MEEGWHRVPSPWVSLYPGQPEPPPSWEPDDVKKARAFQKLVSQGSVKAAIRLITEQGGSGSLSLSSVQPDGRTKTTYSLNIRLEYLPHHNSLVMSHLSASLTPSSSNRLMVLSFDALLSRWMALQAPQALTHGHGSVCAHPFKVPLQTCVHPFPVWPGGCVIPMFTLSGSLHWQLAAWLRWINALASGLLHGVGETLRHLISKATLRVTRDGGKSATMCWSGSSV